MFYRRLFLGGMLYIQCKGIDSVDVLLHRIMLKMTKYIKSVDDRQEFIQKTQKNPQNILQCIFDCVNNCLTSSKAQKSSNEKGIHGD